MRSCHSSRRESSSNSHSVAAQTNICVPAMHGIENPDIRNHFICFANHQQTVQRRSPTRQLNVFKRRDSDYHRVLNHHGSHL